MEADGRDVRKDDSCTHPMLTQNLVELPQRQLEVRMSHCKLSAMRGNMTVM